MDREEGQIIRDYINKIRYKSRMAKFNQVITFLKPRPTDRFLEVGVASKEYSLTDNFLIKSYPYRERITALAVGDIKEFKRSYPDINTIVYDGRAFPVTDKCFDIAHSNAVIEHVGPLDAQKLFLKETVRVSKRGMITTPNKYFPIEIHTRVPLLHIYLGKERFDRFLRWIGKDWATGSYMYLLGKKDLEQIADSAGLANYCIVQNRFFGFTATLSLIYFEENGKPIPNGN